jgi:uncharacterized membrane protein
MSAKTMLFLMLTILAMPSMAAPMFSIQSIVSSDPALTMALGINDTGTVAGSHGTPKQGFTLTLPNSFTTMNFPGSTGTQVFDINNSGNTAGFFIDAANGIHGYLYQGGTFTSKDMPGAVVTELLGLNDTNRTVGFSGTGALLGQQAITEQSGVFTTLVLPSNVRSQATRINNAGNIVGWYMPNNTSGVGFLDVGGVISQLVFPGASLTNAWGINDNGEIVGDYTDAANVTHGFIDLGGVFTSFDVPGAGLTTIKDVNSSGQIVGWYTDSAQNIIGFVGTPITVPEPGTLALVALAGLIGIRRRPEISCCR